MMRYWAYIEPTSETDSTPILTTMSDQEIIEQYWEWWYDKMCKKYGKEHVDANFVKLDCIDDWVTTHWAWESK